MEAVRILTDRVASLEEIIRQNGQSFSAMLQRMREVEQYLGNEAQQREQLTQQVAQMQAVLSSNNNNSSNQLEALQQLNNQLQNQSARLNDVQSLAQASQAALRGVDDKNNVAIHALEQRLQNDVQTCHQRLQAQEQSVSEALRNVQSTLQGTNHSIQVVDDRAREAVQALQSNLQSEMNNVRQRHEALETGMRSSLQTLHTTLSDNIQETSNKWESALRTVIDKQNQSMQALDDRIRADMIAMQQTGIAEHTSLRSQIDEAQRTLHDSLQASCHTLANEMAQLSQFGQAIDHRQRTAHQTLVQELAKHDQQMEGIDVSWRASVLEVNSKLERQGKETEEQLKEVEESIRNVRNQNETRFNELATRANEQNTQLNNTIQSKCLRPLDEVRFSVNRYNEDFRKMQHDVESTQKYVQTLTVEVERGTLQFRQMTEAALRAVHANMIERLNALSTAVAQRAEPAEVHALIDQALSKVWSDIRKNFSSQRGMETIHGHLNALEGAVQKEVCALFSQVGQLNNHVQELSAVTNDINENNNNNNNDSSDTRRKKRKSKYDDDDSTSSSSDSSSSSSDDESSRSRRSKRRKNKKNKRATLDDVLSLFSTKEAIEKEAVKVHEESVRVENNLFTCNKVADDIKSSIAEAKSAATNAQNALATIREAQLELQRKLITVMQGQANAQGEGKSFYGPTSMDLMLNSFVMDNTLNKDNKNNNNSIIAGLPSANNLSLLSSPNFRPLTHEQEMDVQKERELNDANEQLYKSINQSVLEWEDNSSSDDELDSSLDDLLDDENNSDTDSNDAHHSRNDRRGLTHQEMKNILMKINKKFVPRSHYTTFKKQVYKNLEMLHKKLKTLASIKPASGQILNVVKVQNWIRQSKEEVSRAVLERVDHHEKSMTAMLKTIRSEIEELNNNPAYIRVPGGKFGLSMSNIDTASNSTIANDTRLVEMDLNKSGSHRPSVQKSRPPNQLVQVKNSSSSSSSLHSGGASLNNTFTKDRNVGKNENKKDSIDNSNKSNKSNVERKKVNEKRESSDNSEEDEYTYVNEDSSEDASSENDQDEMEENGQNEKLREVKKRNGPPPQTESHVPRNSSANKLRLPVLAANKRGPPPQAPPEKVRRGSASMRSNDSSMSNLNSSVRSTNSRGSSAASPIRSTSQLARKASALEKELEKRLGPSASAPSQTQLRQGVPKPLEHKKNVLPPSSTSATSSSTQKTKTNTTQPSPQRRLSAFDRLYQTPTGNTSPSSNSILRSPSSQASRSRPSSLSSANRATRTGLTPRQPPEERNSNMKNSTNTPTSLSRRKSISGEERKPAWNSLSRKNSTDNQPSSFARRNSYNMSLKNNNNNSRRPSVDNNSRRPSVDNNSRRPSVTEARPSSSVSSYVSDASSVRSSRRPSNMPPSRKPASGNAVRVHPVDKPLVLGTYSTYE